jgi:hypothetical protein
MAVAAVQLAIAAYGAMKARKAEKKQRQAQQRVEEAEAGRQQQIDLTRGYIDSAFNSKTRQKQYADYAQALRDYYGEQLGRKKLDSSRKLKFATASSGLTGGSFNADSMSRLGDEFSRGAVENERRAQRGLADLRSADEASKLNLHQLAMSGLDATTGLRRSAESMGANLQTQRNTAQMEGIGDVFADTSDTYKTIQERNALRRGYGAPPRRDLYG